MNAWFMDYAEAQRRLHGWSAAASTGELAPEVFDGCSDQIFRRWRAVPLAETRGRHAILSDAVTAKLASTALELTSKGALSSHIIRQILSDEIFDLGISATSARWTRRFLTGLGRSDKQESKLGE